VNNRPQQNKSGAVVKRPFSKSRPTEIMLDSGRHYRRCLVTESDLKRGRRRRSCPETATTVELAGGHVLPPFGRTSKRCVRGVLSRKVTGSRPSPSQNQKQQFANLYVRLKINTISVFTRFQTYFVIIRAITITRVFYVFRVSRSF